MRPLASAWKPRVYSLNLALQSTIDSAMITMAGNSSANTNGIATLEVVFSDPPTLADLEAVLAKINEFILGARR